MRRLIRAKKGQFSVIAALLVSVILIMSVISMYSMVRYSSFQDSPNVLTAIGEMNTDLKKILDFTVGYYGSILRVTGNSTYAKQLTTSYLSSGLVNVARSHPDWNPSFELDSQSFSTRWFMPTSHSMGTLSVKYSLSALGIQGITYETDSALSVEMLEPLSSDEARINVTRDNSEPELGLTKENFLFYNYSYTESKWELVNPTDIIISSNGIYTITLPEGINPDAYSIQVEDNRGLIVPAFYSQGSIEESGVPHYTYTFDWESTGMLDIYTSLDTDTFAIELLQNGTLKWLGQPLELLNNERPIPPVSVKAFRVNATIDGVNQEVPFQVEDWASDYMVPLGLSGNDSIFSNTNMLVFLINDHVSEVTLWWDGNDTAIQTPYAWQNLYFTDYPDYNPSYGLLNNGLLELQVNNFWIESTVEGTSTSCRADFMRVNYPDGQSQYGDQLAYVIYNGVVRDIVQQEPEYDNGVDDCPNFYSQVILTFPANATYYTYSARTIFLDSTQPRNIDDLSVIQLSDFHGDALTEDGTTVDGYPDASFYVGYFSDGSPASGDHHWSQLCSGNSGAGLMFNDKAQEGLYVFDSFTHSNSGALFVDDDWDDETIEFNPVEESLTSVYGYTDSLDAFWCGAVVTFNSEPIHPTSGHTGLWVMVEHPPTVSMDEVVEEPEPEPEPGFEFYVDELSDADSSPDKGTHSDFPAQQDGPDYTFDLLTEATESEDTEYLVDQLYNIDGSADVGTHSNFVNQQFGPDSVYDTLTEENIGDSNTVFLINGESFEDWLTAGWSVTGDDWGPKSAWSAEGSNSAGIDGNRNQNAGGTLTTDALDCSDASSISVEFSFYNDGLDDNDLFLQYFNGADWVTVANLGHLENGLHHYEHEITESQYFVSNFMVRWYADDIGVETWWWIFPASYEHAYVDLVTVTKQVPQTSYDLDLEVQWTDVSYTLQNEVLSIYCGSVGDEVLFIDAWTGSTWETAISVLHDGWNNVSVSQWLTGPDFTIRFSDGTEGGDDTQNSWQIDVALLHVWNNDNYGLDLEERWTNVDYDEANEELCIYVGEVGDENLRVDIWTGSAWETAISALNVGWNNVTISSYLTSEDFIIRFVGTTETGDTTQDYWTIDTTLIRSWT